MAKLKAAVRTIGDHKQRIIVNVCLDGIKIIDEKTEVTRLWLNLFTMLAASTVNGADVPLSIKQTNAQLSIGFSIFIGDNDMILFMSRLCLHYSLVYVFRRQQRCTVSGISVLIICFSM